MQDDEKKVKRLAERPAPQPSKYPLLKEVVAHNDIYSSTEDAAEEKEKNKLLDRVEFGRDFHTRIAKLNNKQYDALFSNTKTCADVLAIYKIRKGLFCACKGEGVINLPCTKFLYSNSTTYCTQCKVLKKLFSDTPLKNQRKPLPLIFKGFYLWRRSKPLSDMPCKIPNYYNDIDPQYIHPHRKVGAERLVTELDILRVTADKYIALYQHEFKTFWSQLVLPEDIFQEVIQYPNRHG